MQKVLTAEEMREVDRLTTEKYGIPSILLMENAAHAAARIISEKIGGVKGKSFLILCGKGNNGGDGAALARILTLQGAKVFTNLFGKIEDAKGDANINFKVLRQQGSVDYYQWNWFEFEVFEDFAAWKKVFTRYYKSNQVDCIIDACFGTGLSKPIVSIVSEVINFFLNLKRNNDESSLPLFISIDLPSGLNADLGETIGANFHADLTVTFTAPKIGNVLPPASSFNGELIIANIGSPKSLIDDALSRIFVTEKQDVKNWLEETKYTSDSYKNKRGHALLIVGSKEYTGAAVLAGNAAMLSGAGLTTIATSETARDLIAARVLEEVITHGLPATKSGAIGGKAWEIVEKLTEKVDVVGIGCGLSAEEKATKEFVREVVEKRTTPTVIDADGLNALSPFDLKGSDALPVILTPHEGEFLRLLGTKDKEILRDRVKAVRDFAVKHHVILVLKGERVLIGAPDGTVVINPTGNSGLGKAGNGDTLTGIITGFVAQAVQMKVDIFETVVAAVYISSLAGDIAAEKFGKRSMLASDVRECLGAAFESIENEK